MTRAESCAGLLGGREVMGLNFANPVGLAAGFDRDGGRAVALGVLGFGHVEIGTLFAGCAVKFARSAASPRIGANIGARRAGLDADAIEEYAAAFRAVHNAADYVCANLSSPFAVRDADTPGADRLIARLIDERDARAAVTGRRAKLLVKLRDDGERRWPAALVAARKKLDGVVLVSSDLGRIAAVAEYLERGALISVGGVATVGDVIGRLKAGAALVQIYSAFAEGGASALHKILAGLPGDWSAGGRAHIG